MQPNRGYYALLALVVLLTACEPEATPFPVDIPTPVTPTTVPGETAPIRYALADNTRGSVKDLALLGANAQVTQLEGPTDLAEPGGQFDIIASFGLDPDATPSPVRAHFGVIVYSLDPLDDPALVNILQRSIDPAGITALVDLAGIEASGDNPVSIGDLRAELANEGWPDGFDLRLTYDSLIGTAALQSYWQQYQINLTLIPAVDDFPTHLALITWNTPEMRQEQVDQIGEAGILIDLFSVPISYRAVPGLAITYSPQGWPIATRP